MLPINAWTALIRGDAGWPRPLGEQGLATLWFEVPVSTSRSSVVVDGVAISSDQSLVVVAEAKSGGTVNTDQAQKYDAMVIGDLRRIVTVNPPKGTDVQLEKVFVCMEDEEDRIRRGLAAAGVSCGLLTVSDAACKLTVPLGSHLRPFKVKVPGPPPALIIVDALSPDDEIERVFVPGVVAAMARGETSVPVYSLIERIPHLANFGDSAKSRLATRVTEVLEAVAKLRFRDDFMVSRSGGKVQNRSGGVVTILRSPHDSDPRGRTQGWQRLQRSAAGRGRGWRKEITGQLSLDEFADEIDNGGA